MRNKKGRKGRPGVWAAEWGKYVHDVYVCMGEELDMKSELGMNRKLGIEDGDGEGDADGLDGICIRAESKGQQPYVREIHNANGTVKVLK